MKVFESFILGYNLTPKGLLPAVQFKSNNNIQDRRPVVAALEAFVGADLMIARKVTHPSAMATARVFNNLLNGRASKEILDTFDVSQGIKHVFVGNRNFFLDETEGCLNYIWTSNGTVSFPYVIPETHTSEEISYTARVTKVSGRRWDVVVYRNGRVVYSAVALTNADAIRNILEQLRQSIIPSTFEYKYLQSLPHPSTAFVDEYTSSSYFHEGCDILPFDDMDRQEIKTGKFLSRAANAMRKITNGNIAYTVNENKLTPLTNLSGLFLTTRGEIYNKHDEKVYKIKHPEGLPPFYMVNNFLGIPTNTIRIPASLIKVQSK